MSVLWYKWHPRSLVSSSSDLISTAGWDQREKKDGNKVFPNLLEIALSMYLYYSFLRKSQGQAGFPTLLHTLCVSYLQLVPPQIERSDWGLNDTLIDSPRNLANPAWPWGTNSKGTLGSLHKSECCVGPTETITMLQMSELGNHILPISISTSISYPPYIRIHIPRSAG